MSIFLYDNFVVGPMARPGARGPGLKYEFVLRAGPGLDIVFMGRAGPGPHNSICGPGPGRDSTSDAGPGPARASNHICGPGLGPKFRPVQDTSTDQQYNIIWTKINTPGYIDFFILI